VSASLGKYARQAVGALFCAFAIVAAGCHNNNATTGYGIAWTTLTDEPGDYSSYIVTIDSVTLTSNTGAVYTAAAIPEIVNLAQYNNLAELWSSSGVPVGTYVSATINMDYTNAAITVLVNGVPQKATLRDYTTGALNPTTYSITVNFDPANPLVITPTFASTSAQRLAIDFNLAASGRVDLTTNPATVLVRPFLTAGILPADTKLIRVRGPLINSNLGVGTYTIYVRPFYDEANNIGTLTLFNQPNTIYTINGNNYVGQAGLKTLSLLSAGSTTVAAYTTFQPTVNNNPSPPSTAGKFNLVYVVGASSLEDFYTEGLSGEVIRRVGDTVTLLGSTLFLNTANTYVYEVAPTRLLLGSGTIVTTDDSPVNGLNVSSIAVGQHISARGIYSVLTDGTVQLDATGTSSTNTGSVRLQTTQFWGSLVSSAPASLVMNLSSINDFPVSDYDFTGNGATAAGNPLPSAFSVNTAGLTLPIGTKAGDPVWVNGLLTRFGAAPPDLDANAANNELSVQTAGGQEGGAASTAPGVETCGVASQICNPASLQVLWTSPPGTTAPFDTVSSSGFTINLAQAEYLTGVIRIGPESIDLKSIPAVMVVPTTLPVTSTFSPLYAFGNPGVSAATVSAGIAVYSSFSQFIAALTPAISAANPVKQLEARGVYDRATNTFIATSVNFVL
jgi:hypothetical protein